MHFFDFDDTIIRTMDFQYDSYRLALKSVANFELTKDVFDGYAGNNGKVVLKNLLPDDDLVKKVYETKKLFMKYVKIGLSQ